ncbi:hypothetical protein K227x_16110 [Rubripirellula lacrimiformis]|uniref:Uncharacterized protein n=1 Tax=Rubripirellula lacrimiformis TaxID=1930273 RepID=A0A517N7W4_9BACT|nr:zf-HC2 domain-containing protein [Rubripirellula lacrimiformis]QDT03229.1 hypothetical protein K227x_16110 [Rubripirellula lacrimiformis]
MTVPQSHIDQMLSAYLDDALSAEERIEVQQWIRTDAIVADQLEQLQEQRRSLQAISSQDRQVKLDPGFANRVLELAVARARSEGLAEDHPLVRVSEQPTSIASSYAPVSWGRIVGITAALAASVALAIVVLSPTTPPIAQSNSSPSNSSLADGSSQAESQVAGSPTAQQQRDVDPLNNTESRLAQTPAADANIPGSDVNDSIDSQLSQDTIAASAPMANQPPLTTEPAAGPSLMTAESTPSGAKVALSAVLVLDVHQTESGRASGAIQRAMRTANISNDNRQQVSLPIANSATETVGIDSEEKVALMYLQAPAKALDEFYLTLLDDSEGIASVGMTIAMDAPLLDLVNATSIDPTSVQHGGMQMIATDSEQAQALSSRLSRMKFVPLKQSMSAAAAIPSGPQVNAQVLVLVR